MGFNPLPYIFHYINEICVSIFKNGWDTLVHWLIFFCHMLTSVSHELIMNKCLEYAQQVLESYSVCCTSKMLPKLL